MRETFCSVLGIIHESGMSVLEAMKAAVKDKLKDLSTKLFAKGAFAKSMAKVLAAKALLDKAVPEPKVEEQPVVKPPQMAAVEEQPAAADLEAQAKCKLQVGDRFRVSHEDFVHKLKYGASGCVIKVIDENHIEGRLESGLAAVTLPTFLLENVKGLKKAEPLKNLTRIAMSEKRSLLMEIGERRVR